MNIEKVDTQLPISLHEATIKRHYAKHLGEIIADDVLELDDRRGASRPRERGAGAASA